jgi:hypothetical protein
VTTHLDLDDLDEPSHDDRAAIDDDPLFDADVATLMQAEAVQENNRRGLYNLGQRLGSLYAGMINTGMDRDDATGLVHDWMRCAIFREVDRETGTYGIE